MIHPGLLDGSFESFDEPSSSTPERFEFATAGRNGKSATPAWKRIEELREMRELNRHLKDDIYGSKPLRSLWND